MAQIGKATKEDIRGTFKDDWFIQCSFEDIFEALEAGDEVKVFDETVNLIHTLIRENNKLLPDVIAALEAMRNVMRKEVAA